MTKRSSGSFFGVNVYLSYAQSRDIDKKEKVQNNMHFSTTSTLTRTPTFKVKKTAAPSECTLFNLDINVNGLIFIQLFSTLSTQGALHTKALLSMLFLSNIHTAMDVLESNLGQYLAQGYLVCRLQQKNQPPPSDQAVTSSIT